MRGSVDVIGRTELVREVLLAGTAGERDRAEAHFAGELNGEMAEAAETLDRDDVAGGGVHVAHAVEYSHSCTTIDEH